MCKNIIFTQWKIKIQSDYLFLFNLAVKTIHICLLLCWGNKDCFFITKLEMYKSIIYNHFDLILLKNILVRFIVWSYATFLLNSYSMYNNLVNSNYLFCASFLIILLFMLLYSDTFWALMDYVSFFNLKKLKVITQMKEGLCHQSR